MAKGKALALRKAGAVGPVGGYDQYAGAGSETATSADLSISRLAMLHDLSPQVKEKNPDYIKGAKAGMIFNTVTKEVFEELYLVPCCYRRSFVEWVERDQGGGFVAEHLEVNPKWERQDRGPYLVSKKVTADKKDHIVNDTRSFFVYYSPDEALDDAKNAVVGMTASQIRRAANWLTIASSKTFKNGSGKVGKLPLFAGVYHAEGEYQENEKGSWYAWKITDTGRLLQPGDAVFQQAAAFYAMVVSGKVAAAPPVADSTAEGDGGRM